MPGVDVARSRAPGIRRQLLGVTEGGAEQDARRGRDRERYVFSASGARRDGARGRGTLAARARARDTRLELLRAKFDGGRLTRRQSL